MFKFSTVGLTVAGAIALLPVAAHASVTLLTTQTSDTAFEGAGGYLQTQYNLPLVASSALIPIERAVGQARIGVTSYTRGLHTPGASSGVPGVGAGITSALTNYSPLATASTVAWANATPVAFSMTRVGTTVSYTVGAQSWSQSASYFADINAFELRLQSRTPNANTTASQMAVTGVTFTDASVTNQALGDLYAADGATLIKLWTGLSGDFTIAGNYAMSWTGTKPQNSNIASQLKLLALPVTSAAPEPAQWALLISGFGLAGAGLRRRRMALA